MSRAMTRRMKKQRQRFIDKFGREPGADDPVFFDPDADTPQPLDGDAVMLAAVDAMEKAGIDPRLVYACAKTERMLTEKTYREVSQEERDEWDAALREYDRLEGVKSA